VSKPFAIVLIAIGVSSCGGSPKGPSPQNDLCTAAPRACTTVGSLRGAYSGYPTLSIVDEGARYAFNNPSLAVCDAPACD